MFVSSQAARKRILAGTEQPDSARILGAVVPSNELELAVKLLEKIHHWYNKERQHNTLGYLRPVDYYHGNPEVLKEECRVKMAQACHRHKQINLQLIQPTLPLVT